MLKWAIGVGGTIFLTGALFAADSRWLQKISFEEYQVAQIKRDNQAEVRALDRRILDVETELKYGILTVERKAQLEQLLQLLLVQKEELHNEMGLLE
jgi:hypothetical protein